MDISEIIKGHLNAEGGMDAGSIEAFCENLKKEIGKGFVPIDRYNKQKELAAQLSREADESKAKLDEGGKAQSELERLKKEYSEYKAGQEAKALRGEKEAAYKAILKGMGVPEKRYGAILRTLDFDKLEMKDGKFSDDVANEAKEDWGDFALTMTETGVASANPPTEAGAKHHITKEEIDAIKDTTARQRAIAENLDLYL